MATPGEDEQRGAYLLYSLFHKYASRDPAGTSYGVVGITYTGMKDFLLDMDLLEGVPPALVDVFVREHLLRADQDGSGLIGAQDLLVWMLTEVAALLPLRDAFCRVTGQRPLYNQYHAVLLGDVGFTDGARRPALGMSAAQFSRMAEEYGLSSSPEDVRYAFKAARASIGAFRGSSGANTGGQMGEPAAGGRLQFAAFVRALAILAAQRMGSLDAALYQVVSRGVPANLTDPRVTKPPLPPEALTSLGLESRLEGSTTKESYACTNCDQEHQRWRLNNWLMLEEVVLSLGIPHPVRRFLPALPLLNTRNLRAAFHRYNAKYNRGKLPPASYKLPREAAVESGANRGCGSGGRWDAGADGVGAPEKSSAPGGGGGGCSQPAAYGACCCLFRSLSLMEMSSWLRLCGDCDAIRELIATHGSGVTPAILESAFVQASSIAGVYCPDDSSGIHDAPIGPRESAAKLALPRNGMGAVVVSEARAAPDHPPPNRSTAAYHAPPDAHPMAEAKAAASGPGGGGGSGAVRLHEVQGPNSAAAWLASARSLPFGSDAGSGGGGSAAAVRGQQHRPSRLALTFPQFVEALRLVAEEAGGYPTRTAASERALLRIVHDIVREGCPRPDLTTAAGIAQHRRQQLHSAAARFVGVSGKSRAPGPSPPPRPATAAGAGSSSSTSTKYTYDDFTPPESNLYTSETSSRIGSQPESVKAGQNGGDGDSGGGRDNGAPWQGHASKASMCATSSSTSTKYTYDDFTPLDSDAYTSATSSRVGSRAAIQAQSCSNQSWWPQPRKGFSNPIAASGTGGGGAGGGGGGGDGGGSGVRPLPAQLQPKRHGSAVAAAATTATAAAEAATVVAAAAAVTAAPLPPSAWIMTMPPSPSARIRKSNVPPASGSAGLAGSGGSPSASRSRPMSAPRIRQQSSAVGLGDQIEYIVYGSAAATGGSGGDRPASRPRPVSARTLMGPYPGGTEAASAAGFGGLGGGGVGGAAAAIAAAVNPPFAPRARPASPSLQRPGPFTARERNVRVKSPPPAVSYPSAGGAAAAAARAAAAWDPPGVSGFVRPSSTATTRANRSSSANATTAGRTGGSGGDGGSPAAAKAAAMRQQNKVTSVADTGVSRPPSRVPNPIPKALAAAAATAAIRGGGGGGGRPAAGRPPVDPHAGRTGGSTRMPSGTGFVSPLVPASSGGADGDVRLGSPPTRRLNGAAAAAMNAEAAAAAALAAAATARHASLGRPPPPYSGLGEQPLVTVHPNHPDGAGHGGGFGGFGGGGGGRSGGWRASTGSIGHVHGVVCGNTRGDAPAPPPPPAPSSGSSPAAAANRLLLLQTADTTTSAPSLGSHIARSPTEITRVSPPPPPQPHKPQVTGASAAIWRTESVANSVARPLPSGAAQLEHVLPSEPATSVSVGLLLIQRPPPMGSSGGGAKAPPSFTGEEEEAEEGGANRGGTWGRSVAMDDVSSAGGVGDGGDGGDTESVMAPSPRAVMAASMSVRVEPVVWRRSRLPAEGTVNALPQYFFG